MDKEKIKIIFELGSYNLDNAKKLIYNYPDSICYSFECNPDCLIECKKRICNFTENEKKKIFLIEKAVSISNGQTRFHPFDLTKYNNMGASSILEIDFSRRDPTDPDYSIGCVQKKITVDGIRLDTFMKDNNINNIDLLCVGLQGYELNALRSLGENLKNIKYIISECSIESTYTGGCIFTDLNNYLINYGFKYVNSNKFGDNFPNLKLKGYSKFNALFINHSELNLNKRIGILLTGRLCFKNNEFDIFYNKIKNYDIYISTYLEYKDVAYKLNPKYCHFIDNDIYIDKNNTSHNILEYIKIFRKNKSIHQFYHLEKLISLTYKSLTNYDILIKLRTFTEHIDLNFKKYNINNIIDCEDNIVYFHTDILFYGHTKHFIKIFNNIFQMFDKVYWHDTPSQRYYHINYDYFLKSDLNYSKWWWIDLPIFLYNTTNIDSSSINLLDKEKKHQQKHNSLNETINIIKENIVKHSDTLINKNFDKNKVKSLKDWHGCIDCEQHFLIHLLRNTIVKRSKITICF